MVVRFEVTLSQRAHGVGVVEDHWLSNDGSHRHGKELARWLNAVHGCRIKCGGKLGVGCFIMKLLVIMVELHLAQGIEVITLGCLGVLVSSLEGFF